MPCAVPRDAQLAGPRKEPDGELEFADSIWMTPLEVMRASAGVPPDANSLETGDISRASGESRKAPLDR